MKRKQRAPHPGARQDDGADALRLAADPTTPAETLARFSDNPLLAPLVASNPNAPLDLALRLAADFPRAFLDNPALPFLLLETPDLPQRLSSDAAIALLRFADTPAVVVKQLRASKVKLVAELAQAHVSQTRESNPQRERTEFHRLFSDASLDDKQWLLLPGLAPEWFLALLTDNPALAAALAQSANYPVGYTRKDWDARQWEAHIAVIEIVPTFLETLIKSGDYATRIAIARRPNLPEWVRRRLAQDPAVRIRHVVAADPQTPPHLLRALAQDHEITVRYGIALNTGAEPGLLRILMCDPNEHIRAAVARNPATPQRTLDQLLNDTALVRASLARNPACPERIHLWLLDDPEITVRWAALRYVRPTAPGIDLPALMVDDGLAIVLACNERMPTASLTTLALRVPLRRASRRERLVAEALARNPTTPGEALDHLARIPDAPTQALVACHPHTAPTTLAWLGAQPSLRRNIALTLAHNPIMPEWAVWRLAATRDSTLALAVAPRLSVTPDSRDQFYVTLLRYNLHGVFTPPVGYQPAPHVPNVPQAHPTGYTRPTTNRFLRLIIFASPLLSAGEYAIGANSPVWSERYVVAKNPAAPRALLEALARDGISYVRAAALATLEAISNGGHMASAVQPQ